MVGTGEKPKPGLEFEKAKRLLLSPDVGPNTTAMFWAMSVVIKFSPEETGKHDFHHDIEQVKEEAIEKTLCWKKRPFFEKLPPDVLEDIAQIIRGQMVAGNSNVYQKSDPFLQRVVDRLSGNPSHEPEEEKKKAGENIFLEDDGYPD